jgi:ABC-2 type transport system ATP-binding protein
VENKDAQTQPPKMRVEAPEAPVMIKVENVSKKFGNFTALNDISFEVRQGEVLGFLGPNGAGKTTAMRILSGYFPPASGSVWIEGIELFKNPLEVKRRIGYLPESVGLYSDMQVEEFLRFVSQMKSVPKENQREQIEEQINRCGLGEVRHRMIGWLSKGTRQRVALAQALIGNPDILLLDEPTSGLDPKQITEIRTLIRELGRERTLILSTHILPEVSMVCDRVLILNQGKVAAAGTTDQLGAGLQPCQEVVLILGDRHRKEEALRLLRSLKGIERIGLLEEAGDRVALELRVAKGLELGPEMTRLFVEHRIPLLELRSSRLSLEEIFLKLVVNESSQTAAA